MDIKKQILDYIFQNENSLNEDDCNNKIGIEIEHFVVDQDGNSVFYQPGNDSQTKYFCVEDILFSLSKFYSKKKFSDFDGKKHLIGLIREDISISLEPGAQLEVSIAPSNNIKQIEAAYNKFLSEIQPILDEHNYHLEYLGYRPDICAYEVPLLPKQRYYYMDAHFKNVGKQGIQMMRNTASVHISVDFNSIDDFKKKYKLAAFLSPLFYFLYDNCPVFERQLNESQSMIRHQIWKNTDADRCGIPSIFFESNFDPSVYAERILDLPLIDGSDASDARSKKEEIERILSLAFYDVRVKNYLEIRCADSMPLKYTLSYAAFIKGLIYDNDAMDKALCLFDNCSFKDYECACKELEHNGWDATIYNHSVHEVLDLLIAISKNALSNDDLHYLAPTENLIRKRKCLKNTLHSQMFKIPKTNIEPASMVYKFNRFQKEYFLDNEGCLSNRHQRFLQHKNSKAIFEDKVVDTCYFPKVYDKSAILQFEDIVKTTYSIWTKLTDLYFSNPEFASLYKWDSFSEKLINFRPKYSSPVPIARIDVFYDDITGQFQICEFNTGGTAAQSEVSYLSQDAVMSQPFNAVQNYFQQQGYSLKSWELYNKWVHTFINIYNEWADNTSRPHALRHSGNFNIAIVDFLENSQILDFELFKNAFNKQGYNCKICDIRELTYDGNALYTQDGTLINAVYKRATLNDVIPLQDDPGLIALINAVFDDNVCPIDWFNTQIIHDKQISYILRSPQFQQLLTPSEASFVNCHVPFTQRLTSENCHWTKFLNNKECFIVKPLNGRRSKDIFSGKDLTKNKWAKTLVKCAEDDNFIIQEFCKQYTSPNIEISVSDPSSFLNKNYKDAIKLFANMEGLYCYDGNFAGVWLRQGDHSKTSTTYNVTTPTFYEV